MSDKKISQLQVANLPLDGSELIPVVQDGINKRVISSELPAPKVENLIYIPELIVSLKKKYFGDRSVFVSWHSSNLNFLNYDPKIFLFRYRGKRAERKFGEYVPAKKGFRHPVHMNGVNHAGHSGWWAGTSYNIVGDVMPPRVTEWTVPMVAGESLDLLLNKSDWVYSIDIPPCSIENYRVRGATSTNNRTAYFSFAIKLTLPSTDSTKCPVVFGPMSKVIGLRPKYDWELSLWRGWDWFLA